MSVKRYWIVPAMVAMALVQAGLDRDSGLRTWWRLDEEVGALNARIATLEVEIAELEAAAQALDGDPFALERAIREDLGLARPGETVVRFDRSSVSSPRNP